MKKTLPLLIAGLLPFLLICASCAAQPAASINVKDFGARGDGVTDDTAAIQEAVHAARARSRSYWNDMCGVAHPEIVFPSGVYVISRPIIFANTDLSPLCALIRGIGAVIIRQTNPDADAFYFHFAYRVTLDNVKFDGGKRSVKIWTNNMDTSTLALRNCVFANSTHYAVECISRRKDGKQVDHYDINQDGSTTYIDGSDAPYYFNSTVLHINNCAFTKCMRILHTNTDGCFVENCRMETNPEMTGAAIRNGGEIPIIFGGSGVLKMENVKCFFHVRDGKDQRFVDNWNFGVTLRNVRITTDSDRGVCPVHNKAKFRTGFATQAYVILEDSQFQAAGSPEDAIVYCEEVPNILSVRNCESSNGPVSALGFPEVPTPEYFRMYSHCREPMPADGLGFTVDAGNRGIRPNLPPSMRPFQRKPLPANVDSTIRKWLTDKEAFLSENSMKTTPVRIMSAADYGVKGDGVTDDTQAIRKAIAAAARLPGCELQFPGGIYKIQGTIDLPSDVRIRGMGRAAFFAIKPGAARFRVRAARAVAFYNCAFESLSSAASITISRGSANPARILFKNCLFSHTRGTAVECVAGNLRTDGSSFARLRITDSLFYACKKNLVSNVSAIVDNNWISTVNAKKEDTLRDFAAFENYGVLRLENAVGVPLIDAFGRNIRWIDNYGRLFVTSIRFGGEFGGACAVNVKKTPGVRNNTVVIQNGWLFNQDTRGWQALVHCEAIPDTLVLRTNVGAETPKWILGSQLATVRAKDSATAKSLRSRLLFSGNTIPEDIACDFPASSESLAPPVIAKATTNPIDGAQMVLVPAGNSLMGSTARLPDELPKHTVHLDAYRIYKHEVTVAQYRKFCEATGRAMPNSPAPWNTEDQAAVVDVTWEDAEAYAKWAGGRLPTEAEWERAARATDGRQYPWGNDWDRHKCQQYDTGNQVVMRVGSYPADLSPYGCYDMAGNATEWCSDWYAADYYSVSPKANPTGPSAGKYRVVRGGGWSNLAERGGIRCASRKMAVPGYHWLDIGFRVVTPAVL